MSRSCPRPTNRLRRILEHLEDRRTPTSVSWDGGAGTNQWSDALNWSSDVLPQTGDDVTILSGSGVEFTAAAGTSVLGTIACSVPFKLSGGVLDVTNTALFTSDFEQLSGTLQGDGTITLGKSWMWTGGTLQGSGLVTLPAVAVGTLDTSTSSLTLSGRSVEHAGKVFWVGSNPIQTGDGGWKVLNGGTFDVQGDGTWAFASGGGGTQINVASGGTLKRSVSSGTVVISGPVKNDGSVVVDAGILNLNAGGSWTGTASLKATLCFTTGSFSLAGGTTMTGAGPLAVVSGTTTATGAVAVDRLDHAGGTIDGSGTITVNSKWSWSGGALQGAGTLALAAAATGTVDTTGSPVSLIGRSVEQSGSVKWVGNNAIQSGDGGWTIKTGATLDVQGNSKWTFAAGAKATPITVETGATLKRSVGAGVVFVAGAVDNQGTVVTDSGVFNLDGGGSWSGSASVAPAATLCFTTGTFTFANGVAVTGGGPLALVSGTLAVDTGSSSVDFLDQTGGTLDGPGTLAVGSKWSWTGGTVKGAGKLAVTGGTVNTTGGAVTLDGRAVEQSGTVVWLGNNAIQTGDGSWTLKSGAILDVQGDGAWTFASGTQATPLAVSAGATLRRSTSAGTATIGGVVTNGGTVAVAAGTLKLGGLANFSAGTLSGGSFVLAGTLRFPGADVVTNLASLTLDGPASALLDDTTAADGLAKLADNSGALTVQGGRTLTVNGPLASYGVTTIAAASTLKTATGDYTHGGSTVVNGTLDPAGKVVMDGGILSGTGTVDSDVDHDVGSIQPAGFAIGQLTIVGNYSQTGGLLSEQIAGVTPVVNYDRLHVTGGVSLGGVLGAAVSFKSAVGNSFAILTNDGVDPTVGEFSGLPENGTLIIGGVRFRVNYNAGDGNDVVLTRLSTVIDSVVIDTGTPQRSLVRSITVTFGGKVALPPTPADAFVLQRTGPGTPGFAAVSVDNSLSTSTQTIVRLTFNGALSEFGSLADGKYNLSVLGNLLIDNSGQLVDGDGDGAAGGTGVTSLHRLFGDLDGDADVDAQDFGAFRGAFGLSNFVFDFDGDGDVDAQDFGQFRQRFGLGL